MEDPIFWDKVGAIGTIVGAIATFIASGIALYQSNDMNKRKLKVEINYALIPEVNKEYIVANIINNCNRDIIIKEWSIKLKNKKRLYLMISNNEMNIQPAELPYKLKVDDEIKLFFQYDLFLKKLKQLVKNNDVSKYRKVEFIIIDNLNKTYSKKSKNCIKKILTEDNVKI